MTSASPLPLVEYFNHPLVNKLKFSDDPNVYLYKDGDLEDQGEKLGDSQFSVKKYFHKPSGRYVAAKITEITEHARPTARKHEEKKLSKLFKELEFFHRLGEKKEGFVELHGLCIGSKKAYLCMELMEMSLDDFKNILHEIMAHFGVAFTGILSYVSFCMVSALAYCHEHRLMHRDIKPSNILLDKNYRLKLSDYGEARFLQDEMVSTCCGTMAYWPPERLKCLEKYDSRSDVWSLGVTLYEIWSGTNPFIEVAQGDVVSLQTAIVGVDIGSLMSNLKLVDNVAIEFLSKCLCPVENRSNFKDLMNTPFYKRGMMSFGWVEDIRVIYNLRKRIDEILSTMSKDSNDSTYAMIFRTPMPTNDDEIRLNWGDVVKIKAIDQKGRLLGDINNKVGWFAPDATHDRFFICSSFDDSDDKQNDFCMKFSAAPVNKQHELFKDRPVIEVVYTASSYTTRNINELSFSQGELLEIIDYPIYFPAFWRARNSDGKIGLVPTIHLQLFHLNVPVHLQDRWYFPEILNMEEADALLNSHGVCGDFVIWRDMLWRYIYITFKCPFGNQHLRAQLDVNNRTINFGNKTFPSMVHLILHYAKFPIFMTTKLIKPLLASSPIFNKETKKSLLGKRKMDQFLHKYSKRRLLNYHCKPVKYKVDNFMSFGNPPAAS